MTAEIAVLNKSAVALATDSAVTISSDDQALKIFESADKLFELSCTQPIGIMIYNGMQFLGVPMDTIIKEFRRRGREFDTVEQAAECFLQHLYEYVDEAPIEEVARSVSAVVSPVVSEISDRINDAVLERLTEGQAPDSKEKFQEIAQSALDDVLAYYERVMEHLGTAEFIPRNDKKREAKKFRGLIEKAVKGAVSGFAESVTTKIVEIAVKLVNSGFMSRSRTGLVFSGFGERERFPTLVAFEIDGVFEAKIRSIRTDHCDIDRNGRRAYVRPFAQKDMVDRFLHGLDERLRDDITEFCRETIGGISQGIFEKIEFADAEFGLTLRETTTKAEEAFIRNLHESAFRSIQARSRREIEDMVEFMPKPELARMAEALIDLTSIKRKVSQGLETVGGPVDVAVISKSEGFVWVRRKHYFPPELNNRYFGRVSATKELPREESK